MTLDEIIKNTLDASNRHELSELVNNSYYCNVFDVSHGGTLIYIPHVDAEVLFPNKGGC